VSPDPARTRGQREPRLRPLFYVGVSPNRPARWSPTSATSGWSTASSGDVAALLDDVRHRARAGPPLRFGTPAFVIARRSAEEATAELELQWRLGAESDAGRAMPASTDAQARLFASADAIAPDSPCPSAATASPVRGRSLTRALHKYGRLKTSWVHWSATP
jgi:hypothetical protein